MGSIEVESSVPSSRAGAHNGEAYYSPLLVEKYRLDLTKKERLIPEVTNQAHIQFQPSLDEFSARASASLKAGGLTTTVPDGWPLSVENRMTWIGDDYQDESRFVYHLSEDDKAEIVSALQYFRAQDIESINITKKYFPLPKLGAYLQKFKEELYNGVGLVVLRGLDPLDYSLEDLATILLGVSSHIAARRGVQNQLGSILKHIVDYGDIESQSELPFHTDVTCDIVATITRECSVRGGMATLASSSAVYNVLAKERPDLIHVLAKPDWPFDTYGRDPPYYRRALLYHMDRKVVFNFSRRVLCGHPLAPRTRGVPCLTESQAEALDAVHFIAKAIQLKVSMERGDLRLISNIGLLHGREAYSDDNELKSKRHLIRAWLHDEEMAGKLPRELQLVWDRTFMDDSRPTRWQAEPQGADIGPGSRKRADSPSSPCD